MITKFARLEFELFYETVILERGKSIHPEDGFFNALKRRFP
jgi:hypothetical protein